MYHSAPLALVLCDLILSTSAKHRQSSCSVHCTAALPVLAGLADVERIKSHSTNASGAL